MSKKDKEAICTLCEMTPYLPLRHSLPASGDVEDDVTRKSLILIGFQTNNQRSPSRSMSQAKELIEVLLQRWSVEVSL